MAALLAFLLAALFGAAFSHAAVAQTQDSDRIVGSASVEAAHVGAVSPLVLNARLTDGALVLSDSGYDGARRELLFDSAVEVRVWGPIALRAGVTYSEDTRRMRPSFGARVQLLRQATHGLDGSLSAFFKTEGFDEAEGEVETTLALGHRFGQVYVLGNIVYGQDPEGNERDGELRASVLRGQGRGVFGLEARGRSAIGAQHGTNAAVEPRIDVVGGAVGMLVVSSIVLFAEVGPSAFKLQNTELRWGLASMGGVCATF